MPWSERLLEAGRVRRASPSLSDFLGRLGGSSVSDCNRRSLH